MKDQQYLVLECIQEICQCPISHQIMIQPAITVDGHTYQRKQIQKWFDLSQKSPVTGLPLASKALIPNFILKSVTQKICSFFLSKKEQKHNDKNEQLRNDKHQDSQLYERMSDHRQLLMLKRQLQISKNEYQNIIKKKQQKISEMSKDNLKIEQQLTHQKLKLKNFKSLMLFIIVILVVFLLLSILGLTYEREEIRQSRQNNQNIQKKLSQGEKQLKQANDLMIKMNEYYKKRQNPEKYQPKSQIEPQKKEFSTSETEEHLRSLILQRIEKITAYKVLNIQNSSNIQYNQNTILNRQQKYLQSSNKFNQSDLLELQSKNYVKNIGSLNEDLDQQQSKSKSVLIFNFILVFIFINIYKKLTNQARQLIGALYGVFVLFLSVFQLNHYRNSPFYPSGHQHQHQQQNLYSTALLALLVIQFITAMACMVFIIFFRSSNNAFSKIINFLFTIIYIYTWILVVAGVLVIMEKLLNYY